MPRLITNIEGIIFDNFETAVQFVQSVEGFYGPNDEPCGFLDYIDIPSLEAYIQNFSRAEEVEDLITPANLGFKTNQDFETIEISF